MQLLGQTCCFSYKSPRIREVGMLRDLSHGFSVYSGAGSSAERQNLPGRSPILEGTGPAHATLLEREQCFSNWSYRLHYAVE